MTEQKKYVAAVLLRGLIGLNQDIKDTLRMMNLQKRYSCVVVLDTPSSRGMLQKCKDYLTYGEISEEMIKELDAKRVKQNNHYALHPPRGGLERRGTKVPYASKGALGYRGDKINELIKKMI
jgi:large subunit ribosomal protein L30